MLPTAPGYHWLKRPNGERIIVAVEKIGPDFFIRQIDPRVLWHIGPVLEGCEWSGPIECPFDEHRSAMEVQS